MISVRRNALEKLAALSATKPNDKAGRSDIFKLCRKCPQGGRALINGYGYSSKSNRHAFSSVPMTIAELETLVALCKAAPLVVSNDIAEQLLRQLVRYLPESYMQLISEPPGITSFDPSPWEVLTFQLTSAVLTIASNFSYLREDAIGAIYEYLYGWTRLASRAPVEQFEGEELSEEAEEELSGVITATLSVTGFLEAVAKHAAVLLPQQRFEIVQRLRDSLTEQYMTALESILSVTRNARGPQRPLRPWRKYLKHYAAMGRPLGAMLLRLGFIRFTVASISLHVAPTAELQGHYVLNALLHRGFQNDGFHIPDVEVPVDVFAEIALNEIELLEAGSDYLQLGSAWQQHLAFSVKGNALVCFLCCTILDQETADPELLMAWLDSTMGNDVQISDETLASCVFRCMAVLARFSPPTASSLAKALPRVIVQGGLEAKSAKVAADALATVLKLLPQDTVITTLYSLGNVLSSRSPQKNGLPEVNGSMLDGGFEHQTTGSTLSLAPSDATEPSSVYTIVIETIVGISNACGDDKINALALSMLIQKIGRMNQAVDACILQQSAVLALYSAPNTLRQLLTLYTKLAHDALAQKNSIILDAVLKGRLHLSEHIKRGSGNFEPYLLSLLEDIVSKGDVHNAIDASTTNPELATLEIATMLRPLAVLVAQNASQGRSYDNEIEGFASLQRDAWFNIVVHGFTPTSTLGQRWNNELQVLAKYSLPLIAVDRADALESDIELNTVLRRGKSSEHTTAQRAQLVAALPECGPHIQSLNYSELVFLAAANLVETLRATAGDLTHVFTYFLDTQLRSGSLGTCMQAIAMNCVKTYLSNTTRGELQRFSSPYVAQQLAAIFAACCHRIQQVQTVALRCADLIVGMVPSSLCQKTSLFSLLELLTMMWASCLENETDEYEWTSRFTSARENVSIELSDDYGFRRRTLVTLHKWARSWVLRVLDIAPLDIKGLLQTYLSEYDDEGSYGHVSLGRSFALEIGSAVPSTDQRLGAIEIEKGLNINTASDFVAQYTTRQEYRFVQGTQDDDDQEWLRFAGEQDPLMRSQLRFNKTMQDASTVLAELEQKTMRNQLVTIAEIREPLRRAGALLCQTDTDQCSIVHHIVGIPFAVFSKQSIKLGISLWMGVIKENPRMESRILVELAENWENTVRKRQGFFNDHFHHKDPFYIKEEFAPSSREYILRRQHQATNVIAPHFRLVQFLSSHFNATRLGSQQVQRVYYRLMHITLDAMPNVMDHPLARETHFHIVLLGLRILQFGTNMDITTQWRLKDRILTSALAWFARPPQWSYGGNRLQVKAETHLLHDVQDAFNKVQLLGSKPVGALASLQPKQELLTLLLNDEQTRLMMWLFPLDYSSKHHYLHGNHTGPNDATLHAVVKTAWTENPAIAVHLTQRFSSPQLFESVRWLVLNFPAKVLHIPEAIEVLLGPSMPDDVSFQLKYLLYWSAVNPMAAVNYFLPGYGNHPFVIQYAMRALEAHAIDVTFFYVPQIVQTLRYDVLGYVERYIVETGKLSQLFAHQMIWNMKANSFKDEDSQIPDPVKPTLDKVMDRMIADFLPVDRKFYEKEFAFFNEVTDISGKLKPFIKKSKPEKKQKIEEELRKIQVEVGVYLPSNPDGQVIGIDRKSGKPLQSHAKAPFMATFRIRKERNDEDGLEQRLTEAANGDKNTYEVWQSAIFKVGDDCRQDVLALQLIAAFRGIFNNVGLDVYVFPYRVTATAPGCGVIDVLPNSISRDMLGREAVNGLYEYFVSKYGGEDSIRFQEVRNNFVKSMAAYSVISYLLQFKDRHNGNIMVDDQGHILHIDFGFCFDIAPGGVKFERAPFKLTSEMVAVMGGAQNTQPFRWFEELCVKAFLASRQHCEHLAQMVVVMLDSGLPCFKPETMQNFRDRFVLHKTEREAADYMRDLVKKSYQAFSTKGYDQFQLMTNGIPY